MDFLLRRWFIGFDLVSKFLVFGLPTKPGSSAVPLNPRLGPPQPLIFGFLRSIIVQCELDSAHFQDEIGRLCVDHSFAEVHDSHLAIIA